MTFVNDKVIGKIGEGVVKELIEDVYGHKVVDVSEDAEWQKVDVDFLVDGFQVEVKTDTSKTPNIFFETVSNKEKNTPGCMLVTTADFLYYVHLGHNYILTIPLENYRIWVLDIQDELREVNVRTSKAVGLLVPLKRLFDEVEGVGTMSIDYMKLSQEQILERVGAL